MVSVSEAITWALALPEVIQLPHFEKTSFRVRKKIFATLDIVNQRVVVKLSDVDQSVFCTYDPSVIYPVPGAWGKHGATIMELKKVRKAMFKDALETAYCTVAPKSLSAHIVKKKDGV
jgi:hypothetical protein